MPTAKSAIMTSSSLVSYVQKARRGATEYVCAFLGEPDIVVPKKLPKLKVTEMASHLAFFTHPMITLLLGSWQCKSDITKYIHTKRVS